MLHNQVTALIYQELCNNNLDNVEKLNNLLCSISHLKSTNHDNQPQHNAVPLKKFTLR
jgi:hypothetical protein